MSGQNILLISSDEHDPRHIGCSGFVNLWSKFVRKTDGEVIGAKIDQVGRSDCGMQADKLTPLCEAGGHDLSVIPSYQ